MVVGASRGIGFAMVEQLLRRTAGTVVAACRNPRKAHELSALAVAHPDRLHVAAGVDVTQLATLTALAEELSQPPLGGRVDLLINTVGVLHDAGGAPAAPERALRDVQPEWLEHSLRTNAVGPLLLLRELAPLMRARGTERPPSVAAMLSARVGSISDNGLGGWYSYRISKAALNMATRTASLELKRQGTRVLALHPGTVETGLSAPFSGNVSPSKLLTAEGSAAKLLDVIDALGSTEEPGEQHEFFDFNGKRVEW